MFTNSVRLIVVGAALLAAVVTFATSPISGGMFIGGAVLLSVGYVRHGTVWLAFRAQQNGHTDRAKSLLDQIADPNRLSPQNRAYYHLLRGVHAMDVADYVAADSLLARADPARLRTDNDRSMAAALRAAVASRLGDRERASRYLRTAKRYPRKAEITALVERIEGEIAGVP
jgi:tetratricopeptide (TPR) repeat protein